MTTPRATYRLQFHAGFGFRDAARLAPYLADLGVSHVYASPYLKARPGSTHGYDITDHAALNPELGSEADFEAMGRAFGEHGLGQILDFVPNHMGVGGADNPLWLDVLEWGPGSDHAGWFDIDWNSDHAYLKDKLLIPFLGDQYGVVLNDGQLKLKFDAEEGSLAVWAYDSHKLPICPLHYGQILGHEDAALDRLGDLFSDLPQWRPQIAERAGALKAELAAVAREDAAARQALERKVAALNDDHRALDALIGQQFWRIADFRVAGDDINYRRFFNINDLAGLRMELPAVFRHAHALVLPMLRDGVLDGLRIDHIDGLLDPQGYIDALREAAERPFYLVVEKILMGEERPREDWAIEGTTGYDFTNLVLGLLIDTQNEAAFSKTYADFTGETQAFDAIVHACKIRIMESEMASELAVLARDAGRVARQNPLTQDFTTALLGRAIKQIVAGFPIYRTYIELESDDADSADQRALTAAVKQARHWGSEIDPSAFDFLHRLLSGRLTRQPRSGFNRASVLRLAMKLQQYSGPVMAKGLEDTAFYRYNRFIALNEVGGAPRRFGLDAEAFHAANIERARRWPAAMLATATHDTKRGEDTRARLAALADLPEAWAEQVPPWSRLLHARWDETQAGEPPDRNDEYMLYQLLVGAWPPELLDAPTPEGLTAFGARLATVLEKSVREAKLHSNWASPNADYEAALQAFARLALDPATPGFFEAFLPFARGVAALGVRNSLAQTVLKLTVPGMPDLYQGCDLWDFSMVDPDNRRPVDFEARIRALEALKPALETDRAETLREALEHWTDGKIKLAITHLLLNLRAERPGLFASGDYTPLPLTGDAARHAVGFTRTNGETTIAVLCALHPGRGRSGEDAAVNLPAGRWRDLFSGETIEGGRSVDLASVLGLLPASVLIRA
jgi:(1->4)-alpha-D-glucan 1-alpha-D-glucosylmutase